MIRGLGYLLTEISDYETLTNLAQSGNRDIIDLKVKHIYKDSEPPIPGELTAANFGNVLNNMNEHFTNSDKLASVVGVVGEVITTMAITVARECQTKMLFILGLLLIIIPYYEKLLRIILFYEDVILFILKMVHFQVQSVSFI